MQNLWFLSFILILYYFLSTIIIAEATIEEYKEVAKGEKKLNRVNERKKDYVAKEGDKNETVEEIQQRLFDLGYTSQKVTSYYGSITFNNIVYFQIINDLAVTGWVDDETYRYTNA